MNNQDECEKSWEEYKDYLTSGGNFQVNRLDLHNQTFQAAWNIQQKKIDELEQRLELANKVIEKLEDCAEFYAFNSTSVWDVDGEHLLEDESETARATLKEVKELMKGGKHD